MHVIYKKQNRNSIVLALLTIVLILVLAYTATFAFFAGSDSGKNTAVLGGAVLIKVSDKDGQVESGKINFNIGSEYILPGTRLSPSIYSKVVKSSTASVMRAKVIVTVTGATIANKEIMEGVLTSMFLTHSSNAWAVYDDNWFYFVGSPGLDNIAVMQTPAVEHSEANPDYQPEFGTTKAKYNAITELRNDVVTRNTVLASVYAGAGDVTLPFINMPFRIPPYFGNEFSGVNINVEFLIESMQDYIVVDTGEDVGLNVLPTIENVKRIMDELSVNI